MSGNYPDGMGNEGPESGVDMDMIALQWAREHVTDRMRVRISNLVREQLEFLPEEWVPATMDVLDTIMASADIVDLAELGADLTNGHEIPYLSDYAEGND